eukprot:scaffold118032_cov63-Phaeocystis_antarctica.AAC.1
MAQSRIATRGPASLPRVDAAPSPAVLVREREAVVEGPFAVEHAPPEHCMHSLPPNLLALPAAQHDTALPPARDALQRQEVWHARPVQRAAAGGRGGRGGRAPRHGHAAPCHRRRPHGWRASRGRSVVGRVLHRDDAAQQAGDRQDRRAAGRRRAADAGHSARGTLAVQTAALWSRHAAVGEHRARALHVHDGLEHARAQVRLGRRLRRRAQPRAPRDAGDGSGAAQARQPHLQRAHGGRHNRHRRGRVDVRGQRHDVERAGLLLSDGQPAWPKRRIPVPPLAARVAWEARLGALTARHILGMHLNRPGPSSSAWCGRQRVPKSPMPTSASRAPSGCCSEP